MHAVSANVSGQIGSLVIGGIILGVFGGNAGRTAGSEVLFSITL